jgi:Dihaem cytochrome c
MSKKLKIKVLLGVALLLSSTYVAAEEDLWQWLFTFERTKEVKPVSDKQYLTECGECHFAYQPGLLPAKSWEKLLNPAALKNHFGDNAEMDKSVLEPILKYAVDNAADTSYYKRSRKIALETAEGESPLRITDVRYIKRKHKDIPEKMIKGNKDVKSLSYCNKCHTEADSGNYDEDTVSIPNYPDWED